MALTKEATERGLECRVALYECGEVGRPLKEEYRINKGWRPRFSRFQHPRWSRAYLWLVEATVWELISRGLAFVTLPGEMEGSDHRKEDLLLPRVKETAHLVLEVLNTAISQEQLSLYSRSIFTAGRKVQNHLITHDLSSRLRLSWALAWTSSLHESRQSSCGLYMLSCPWLLWGSHIIASFIWPHVQVIDGALDHQQCNELSVQDV